MEVLADFEAMADLFSHIYLFECLIGALFFVILFSSFNLKVHDEIVEGNRFNLLKRVKRRIFVQVALATALMILSAISIILILNYGLLDFESTSFTQNPYLKICISAFFIVCSITFIKNWGNVDKSAKKEITDLWNIECPKIVGFDRARNTLPPNFKYRPLTADELFDPRHDDVNSYFFCDEPAKGSVEEKSNADSSDNTSEGISDIEIEDYEEELELKIQDIVETGSKLDALRYCVEERNMTVEEGLDTVEDCAGPSDEYESDDEDNIEYFLLLKAKDDGVVEAAQYYNEMTDADFFESAEKIKEVADTWGLDLPTDF